MKLLGWLTRERMVGERRAPSGLDWLVALALGIIALLELQSGVFPGPVGVAAVAQLAAIVPVAFRRVAPLAAIAISTAAILTSGVAYGLGNSAADVATLLLLVYSVGRHTQGRRLLVGAAFALLFAAEPSIAGQTGPSEWAVNFIIDGGTLGLGVALRIQEGRSISLAVAADRARRMQEATAQAAVHEERARIARELHDVVAHNVGLIVLQASGARSVLATNPERARTALRQVEETGRQTLTEMRHLVGILREDESADRPPLSLLERLPAFVDEVAGRRAPSALDWLAAFALMVIALIEIASGVFPGPVGVAAAGQLAAIVPVAFRRVAPLAAIAISAAVFLPYVIVYRGVFVAGDSVANTATELLLAYSVGRHTQGRGLLAGAGFALLFAAEPGIAGQTGPSDWAINFVIAGGTLGLGVALRIQQERSIALAVVADRAQSEQEATAQAAVQEERARIARELHDVVAHNVGLIVLQAGGGRSVLATDPERARAALAQVEETGRQTLTEMRHLVGILRVDESDNRQPIPRLDRLPALVEAARVAGFKVDLKVEGLVVGLPTGLELAAYRLIEEALTNVRKHAPTACAQVRLAYEPDRLRIEVSDDGDPSGSSDDWVRNAPGLGYGLIGMRERVQLYGGRMQAGPMPFGGFRVEAVLPLSLETS